MEVRGSHDSWVNLSLLFEVARPLMLNSTTVRCKLHLTFHLPPQVNVNAKHVQAFAGILEHRNVWPVPIHRYIWHMYVIHANECNVYIQTYSYFTVADSQTPALLWKGGRAYYGLHCYLSLFVGVAVPKHRRRRHSIANEILAMSYRAMVRCIHRLVVFSSPPLQGGVSVPWQPCKYTDSAAGGVCCLS